MFISIIIISLSCLSLSLLFLKNYSYLSSHFLDTHLSLSFLFPQLLDQVFLSSIQGGRFAGDVCCWIAIVFIAIIIEHSLPLFYFIPFAHPERQDKIQKKTEESSTHGNEVGSDSIKNFSRKPTFPIDPPSTKQQQFTDSLFKYIPFPMVGNWTLTFLFHTFLHPCPLMVRRYIDTYCVTLLTLSTGWPPTRSHCVIHCIITTDHHHWYSNPEKWPEDIKMFLKTVSPSLTTLLIIVTIKALIVHSDQSSNAPPVPQPLTSSPGNQQPSNGMIPSPPPSPTAPLLSMSLPLPSSPRPPMDPPSLSSFLASLPASLIPSSSVNNDNVIVHSPTGQGNLAGGPINRIPGYGNYDCFFIHTLVQWPFKSVAIAVAVPIVQSNNFTPINGQRTILLIFYLIPGVGLNSNGWMAGFREWKKGQVWCLTGRSEGFKPVTGTNNSNICLFNCCSYVFLFKQTNFEPLVMVPYKSIEGERERERVWKIFKTLKCGVKKEMKRSEKNFTLTFSFFTFGYQMISSFFSLNSLQGRKFSVGWKGITPRILSQFFTIYTPLFFSIFKSVKSKTKMFLERT